jgi:hypothetical protein
MQKIRIRNAWAFYRRVSDAAIVAMLPVLWFFLIRVTYLHLTGRMAIHGRMWALVADLRVDERRYGELLAHVADAP